MLKDRCSWEAAAIGPVGLYAPSAEERLTEGFYNELSILLYLPAEENLVGGGNTFNDGDITYCEAHHEDGEGIAFAEGKRKPVIERKSEKKAPC